MLPDVELPELWRPCLRHVDLEVEIEIEAEPCDDADPDDAWFEASPIEVDELDPARPRQTTSWFWS